MRVHQGWEASPSTERRARVSLHVERLWTRQTLPARERHGHTNSVTSVRIHTVIQSDEVIKWSFCSTISLIKSVMSCSWKRNDSWRDDTDNSCLIWKRENPICKVIQDEPPSPYPIFQSITNAECMNKWFYLWMWRDWNQDICFLKIEVK